MAERERENNPRTLLISLRAGLLFATSLPIGEVMRQPSASTANRLDVTSLALALVVFAGSVGLCIAVNWVLYTDFSSRRTLREAERMRFQAMCADLRMKRRSDPDNRQIARELDKCNVDRSRVAR